MNDLPSSQLNNKKDINRLFHSHHNPAPDFRWAFRILKINKLWILSSVIFSVSVALWSHMSEKNSYRATSILVLNPRDRGTAPFGEVVGLTNGDNFIPKIYTLVEQFKGKEACAALVSSVSSSLNKKYSTSPSRSDSWCYSLSFEPDPERLQIKVVSRTDDPVISKIIANSAGQIFIENDKKRLSHRIFELKRFLSSQEKELGKQLKQIETEKSLFQASSSLISVTQAEKSILDRLEKTEQEYLDLQVQIRNNENLIAQTKKSLVDLKAALIHSDASLSSLYLSQVQYRLNMLQYQKTILKNQSSPDEERKVNTEISQIMKVYRDALDGTGDASLVIGGDPIEYLKSLKASLKTLLKDRVRFQTQAAVLDDTLKKKGTALRDLASSMQRLGELNRENEIANGLYLIIKKRLQETEIEEAASVSDFSVLTAATLGLPENAPLSKKVLFALGIGLFCCLAWIFLRDSMVPSVKDLNDLEQMGLNALGYIPLVPANHLVHSPLLLKDFPDSLEADSFRALRLRMQRFKIALENNSGAAVILVTSPRPASGKTFISSNLAYSLSKGGSKTLLIDLDLRKPSLKNYFDHADVQGHLGDYVRTQDLDGSIEKYSPELHLLLPNGVVENTAEYIENINMENLLTQLRPRYDFIIIDMPPTLSVIDPFLVTSFADLHLLIVQHRKTHRQDVIDSMQILSELKDVPALSLMNMTHPNFISADGDRYYKIITRQKRVS